MSKICIANVQTTKYFPFHYRSIFHWYDIRFKHIYISVTKRCVQILSSALSIVCVIDWVFFMLISQLVGAEGFDLI